jgi:hypothetical protein
MYFIMVALLLLVFPVSSITAEAILTDHAVSTIGLVGKWFAFWAVGIRLFIAGVRQVLQPRFTAEEIFGIRDQASFAIVRELGFANLSMGTLGIWSLIQSGWTVPAALVGGLYYGFAGAGHIFRKGKNAKEMVAMISDAFVFVVLAAFLVIVSRR